MCIHEGIWVKFNRFYTAIYINFITYAFNLFLICFFPFSFNFFPFIYTFCLFFNSLSDTFPTFWFPKMLPNGLKLNLSILVWIIKDLLSLLEPRGLVSSPLILFHWLVKTPSLRPWKICNSNLSLCFAAVLLKKEIAILLT